MPRDVGDPNGIERLGLLASAIAGREVQVAPAAPGEPAWTDGATVYLDATDSWPAQSRALAVQASLLGAGSLDPGILRRLRRDGRRAARYLALEGHRALSINEDFLPLSARSMVEPAVTSTLQTADDSLTAALGRAPVPPAPTWFGVLRVRRILTAVERAQQSSTGDVATPPHGTTAELAELNDDGEPDGGLGDLLTSPVGGGGPLGRLLARLLTPVRNRTGGGPPGADAPSRLRTGGPSDDGSSGTAAVLATAAAPLESGTASPRPAALTYPEWDVHRRRYRPQWCTVIETDAPLGGADEAFSAESLALRRALSRLGMGLERSRRRMQGDDIDIDAAVEARVDALSGTTPGDALYLESLRRRRDLSVLVLLDVSGSAAESGPGGRTVHEHQRAAAAEITTALHQLGDRVALYAFNSQGRRSVRMVRVKAFEDGLDTRVARRLGGLVPGTYTRLGAAIRHGATLVEDHGGTPRRLLVVLSDGFAYDHGYEGAYGEADARRALAEARRRGVGCLCVSIGAGTEAPALRRVFGTAAHASMSSSDQLPRIAGPLFGSAIRSAEAQRRVHQRSERTRERLEIDRRDIARRAS